MSTSPLTAAHFACGDADYKDQPGAIWCLHTGILRDINASNHKKTERLRGIAWVYDTRLLAECYSNLKDLDTSDADRPLLLLWEPPSLDARIAAQGGLLSIMNSRDASQRDFLSTWAARFPKLVVRIVIKASAKSGIRDMLDQNNISERTLFPGLPGLCDWLKRYYGKAW